MPLGDFLRGGFVVPLDRPDELVLEVVDQARLAARRSGSARSDRARLTAAG